MSGKQRSIDDLPRLIRISDVCRATGWTRRSANNRLTRLGVAIRDTGTAVDIDLRQLLAVAPRIGAIVAEHIGRNGQSGQRKSPAR